MRLGYCARGAPVRARATPGSGPRSAVHGCVDPWKEERGHGGHGLEGIVGGIHRRARPLLGSPRLSSAPSAREHWETALAGQAGLNRVALYFEVFRLQAFAVTEIVPAISLAFFTMPVTVA